MTPTPIAVAVVEQAGRFLIGLRPEGVALAGLWEFPGGKVEAGETPAEAAVRECREEAGLEVAVVEEFPAAVQQYDHDRVRVHFFRCRLVEPAPIDGDVSFAAPPVPPRFRWVEGRRLREFTFPQANDRLIAMLSGDSVSGESL